VLLHPLQIIKRCAFSRYIDFYDVSKYSVHLSQKNVTAAVTHSVNSLEQLSCKCQGNKNVQNDKGEKETSR
jgi:hypothetical protein